MRIKRQANARKSLEFFIRSFSFESPHKFLLDPDFLFAILKSGLRLRSALETIISDQGCKIFLTTCIKRELDALAVTPGQRMGEWDAVKGMIENAANNVQYVACRHPKKKKCTAHECIKFAVTATPPAEPKESEPTADGKDGKKPPKKVKEKKSNPEHFICCAQNSILRKELQQIPAVPTTFVHSNIIIFEQPSEATKLYAQRFKSVQHNKVSSKENLAILQRLQQYAPHNNTVLDDALQDGGVLGESMVPLPPERLAEANNNNNNNTKKVSNLPTIGKKLKAKAPNPLANKKGKAKQMPTLSFKNQKKLQEKAANAVSTQPTKKTKANDKQGVKGGANDLVQLSNEKPKTTTTTPKPSNEQKNDKKRKLPQ